MRVMDNGKGVPRQSSIRLVAALRRYAEESERVIDVHGARHGHHKSNLRALLLLMQRQQDGLETTPSDIAKRLNLSFPSTTALVDRLVKLGYVERRRSELDRRSVHIVATDSAIEEGYAIFSPIAQRCVDASEEFTDDELATAERVILVATQALLDTLE